MLKYQNVKSKQYFLMFGDSGEKRSPAERLTLNMDFKYVGRGATCSPHKAREEVKTSTTLAKQVDKISRGSPTRAK